MLNPLRWLRNRRADRRTLAAMTPLQRQIVAAFDVPPSLFPLPGTYENAASVSYGAYAIAAHYLCPAPIVGPLGRQFCAKPLPCTEHRIDNHMTGQILYGNALLEGVSEVRP